MGEWQRLRIESTRLLGDLAELSMIGATPDGGVHRPTFSPAHLEARAWFKRRVGEWGVSYRVDGAANRSAFYSCGKDLASPTLLLGSHLDSVPNGGRFDGSLGVVAALEVIRTIKDAEIELPFHLEAIDFTDEEGTLIGLLGSGALSGKLNMEDIGNSAGEKAVLLDALASQGITINDLLAARRPPGSLAGYLELHIEQGKRLEKAGVEIGVVTSIVGICWYRLFFLGQADHAGTTSMEDRLDASLGASVFIQSARATVMKKFPTCVVNVGQAKFFPGSFNVVPERAMLALEFRSPDAFEFQALEKELLKAAENAAGQFGLSLKAEMITRHQPDPMAEEMQEALESAANNLGLRSIRLASGAGHDAQSLASICPSGMIFVPSVDGASHSPREYTRDEDCINGANVLLQTVLALGLSKI